MYATRRLVLFYISAKYYRNIPKDIRVTERTRNLLQIKQRAITPKVRKAELSSLYATHCLVLFYISTKYHQNILKGIQVTEQTRSFTPTGSVPKTICPPLPTLVEGGRGGDIMKTNIWGTHLIRSLATFTHSGSFEFLLSFQSFWADIVIMHAFVQPYFYYPFIHILSHSVLFIHNTRHIKCNLVLIPMVCRTGQLTYSHDSWQGLVL